MSILHDTTQEIEAVAGLVLHASHLETPEVGALLMGIGRRLRAAHELLTRERGLCPGAEAGSR